MAALDLWVEDKLTELSESDSYGGLTETAQNLLDKHMVSDLAHTRNVLI